MNLIRQINLGVTFPLLVHLQKKSAFGEIAHYCGIYIVICRMSLALTFLPACCTNRLLMPSNLWMWVNCIG